MATHDRNMQHIHRSTSDIAEQSDECLAAFNVADDQLADIHQETSLGIQ
jgi:hypothetical protein